MSGSSLAFSLKNTHMSTKSICLSLVTAFAGPFFSIFCHCHTLIHVTLRRGKAQPPALQHQHQHGSARASHWPGQRAAGGPRGLSFRPGLRVPPQSTRGSDSSHGISAHPCSSSCIFCGLSLKDFKKTSVLYLPCFHAFSSSSHLGGRRRLFKEEKKSNAKAQI